MKNDLDITLQTIPEFRIAYHSKLSDELDDLEYLVTKQLLTQNIAFERGQLSQVVDEWGKAGHSERKILDVIGSVNRKLTKIGLKAGVDRENFLRVVRIHNPDVSPIGPLKDLVDHN